MSPRRGSTPRLTDWPSVVTWLWLALRLSIALMMVVVRTTETSVYFNETARCSVPCCCHLLRTNMSPHSYLFAWRFGTFTHDVNITFQATSSDSVCLRSAATLISQVHLVSHVFPSVQVFPLKFFKHFLFTCALYWPYPYHHPCLFDVWWRVQVRTLLIISVRNENLKLLVYFLKAKQGCTVRKIEKKKKINGYNIHW
jgi:hypothetical protein